MIMNRIGSLFGFALTRNCDPTGSVAKINVNPKQSFLEPSSLQHLGAQRIRNAEKPISDIKQKCLI